MGWGFKHPSHFSYIGVVQSNQPSHLMDAERPSSEIFAKWKAIIILLKQDKNIKGELFKLPFKVN